jgi:hypothetical protein
MSLVIHVVRPTALIKCRKTTKDGNKKGSFVVGDERNISDTCVLKCLHVKTISEENCFVKIAMLIACSLLAQETASVLR